MYVSRFSRARGGPIARWHGDMRPLCWNTWALELLPVYCALGQKLRFDLNHNAKLVDITEYDFQGSFETLVAFVNGMYAGNYDITHIFIDSTLKIVGSDDVEAIESFLARLDAFSEKTGVDVVVAEGSDQAYELMLLD